MLRSNNGKLHFPSCQRAGSSSSELVKLSKAAKDDNHSWGGCCSGEVRVWHCSVRSGDAHVLTGPCERRALALQSARILHSLSPPLVPPVHLQRHQVYASTNKRMHFLGCGSARVYDCPDSVLALGDALGKGCKWAACCEVHVAHFRPHICVRARESQFTMR